ncbi:MAG: DeoR/GlpR transcriptional regulator [Marinovum sp.]|jgi:DeoR family transcriptional regulator, glycerol-3-phosphate regulon repressor|nr:DeoR/GlpR transcriptional regulator [Marinovum sp.]
MSQTFRHPDILEIARSQGKVTVEGLAEHFSVSLQTIRRDLSDLAETGQLERVHGGAIVASGTVNIAYSQRRELNAEAKAAIAADCAAHIPSDCSVFLNIGTTTEAVAKALLEHRNLMVVTNNINVASILAANSSCEIILAGGVLRRKDGGLVGTLTQQSIERFKVDYAVIGCSALDQDGDLLDFDIQEVGVSQTIIGQARQTFLVADQSKFQRSAPVRINSLSALSAVFTDAPLTPSLAERCAAWDTAVHLCA